MAIPSGSGSEVLKRHFVHALSNSETDLIAGVANHIYTVLSISFTEQSGSGSHSLNLAIDANNAGTDIYLLSSQAITSEQTFIWSDKLILTGTDRLHARTASSGNVDVWITYIDQDWST